MGGRSGCKRAALAFLCLVCFASAAVLWTTLCRVHVVKNGLRVVGFYHMYAPPNFPTKLYREHLRQIYASEVFNVTSETYVVLAGRNLRAAKDVLRGAERVSVIRELPSGDEGATLFPLWQHCRGPGAGGMVWYMHGKGSYHPSPRQELWRRVLTRDVLSNGCLQELKNGRDVCGMRFSPAPHAHFPGNFWLARCDYVARLPDLRAQRGTLCFAKKGEEYYRLAHNGPCEHAPMVGCGRFRFKHWIAVGAGNYSDCLSLTHSKRPVAPYVAAGIPLELAGFSRHCMPAPRPGLEAVVRVAYSGFAGVMECNERYDRLLMGSKSAHVSVTPVKRALQVALVCDDGSFGCGLLAAVVKLELELELRLRAVSVLTVALSDAPHLFERGTEFGAVVISGGFAVFGDGKNGKRRRITVDRTCLRVALEALTAGVPVLWSRGYFGALEVFDLSAETWSEVSKLWKGDSSMSMPRLLRIAATPSPLFRLPDLLPEAPESTKQFWAWITRQGIRSSYAVVEGKRWTTEEMRDLIAPVVQSYQHVVWLPLCRSERRRGLSTPLGWVKGAQYEPLLMAQIVAHASLVVGLSVPLSVAAAASGVPVWRVGSDKRLRPLRGVVTAVVARNQSSQLRQLQSGVKEDEGWNHQARSALATHWRDVAQWVSKSRRHQRCRECHVLFEVAAQHMTLLSNETDKCE
jgi:hypothetical protein